MLSLFRFIISKNDQLDNEFCELSNTIERGEITPNILAKYCMPKKSFYELNFFSEKDILELYNDLKNKNPKNLEVVINDMVLPDYKFWSQLCVENFEKIIKEKNQNINYNYIYEEFHKTLNLKYDNIDSKLSI